MTRASAEYAMTRVSAENAMTRVSAPGPMTRAASAGMEANREKGAVLLAVVLLIAMAAAMAASLIERAASAASEFRARRSVLCARYAAVGGLALGAPLANGASLVGPDVRSLMVWRVRMSPAWCVLRASASCDAATRTLDRTLADPSACTVTP
jgi:hypothetical protein